LPFITVYFIYSNFVVGFERLRSKWIFAFLTVAEIICYCFLLYSSHSTKYHRIFRQLKVVEKLIGLDLVQSFMLILGRVGLGHFRCGSGWFGTRKLDVQL